MSASEKLRALDAPYDGAAIARADQKVARGLDLLAALPQIVAVVEAAEKYREEFALRGVQTAESGQAWRNLQAALAALDEALT